MESENVSLFDFDSEIGEMEYIPSEEEMEVVEDGASGIIDENGGMGSVLQGEETAPEGFPEDSLLDSGSGSGSDGSPLSEIQMMQAQALLASTPASGSLSSSTIDYFDRLVSGLPYDYAYVAYRNDSDDSYAGTIIYGGDYALSQDSIVFGEGAVQIDVSRRSGSGYQNYITYDSSDASDVVVTPSIDGTILYYTNAFTGYPVLGGSTRPVGFSQFLTLGLISVIVAVLLGKIFNRG